MFKLAELRALRCTNFRLLADVDLALEPGVFFVGGINLDVPMASSNMSAKSTLLSAITYALYGVDSTGLKIGADAVRTGQKEASVTLVVCPAGREDESLTITRTRRNGSIPIGESRNMLRIEYRDAPGADDWSEYGPAEQLQVKLDARFGQPEMFLAAHVFAYSDGATPFALRADGEQKRLFDLLVDSADLDAALLRVREEIKSVRAELDALAANEIAANARVDTLSAELDNLRNRPTFDEQHAGRLDQARTALLHAHQHKVSLDESVLAQERTLADAERAVADAQQAQAAEIEPLEELLRTLPPEINAQRAAMAALGTSKSGACPVCNAALDEPTRKRLLAERVGAIKKLQARENELRARIAEITRGYDLTALRQTAGAGALGLNSARNKLLAGENNVRRCEAEISQLAVFVNALGQSRALQRQQLEESLAAARKSKARAIAEAAAQAALLDDLAIWEEAFGARGIRAYRLDQITPLLNAIAGKYSNALFGDGTMLRYATQTQNKTGEYRERFETALYDADGKKIEVSLSAGQAMRRDIIHTFGMIELAGKLGKRTLSFIALDEVFRTLDRQGIEAVCGLLDALRVETATTWVIEHNEDLQAHFDRALTVTRENGAARVEYAAQ